MSNIILSFYINRLFPTNLPEQSIKNNYEIISSFLSMEEETTIIALTEKHNEEIPENLRKKEIDSALEKICKTNKKWLWYIFILTTFPGILNGMHITSYVFFVGTHSHYCDIPSLKKVSWTSKQIKNISLSESDPPNVYGCRYYDWDYTNLASKSFDEALDVVKSTKIKPKLLTCHEYIFENNNSVVSEWNLVCDRYYYRSIIQAVFALGKSIGSSFFGVIADKNGRKCSFTLAALCYLLCAVLAAFSNTFSIYLCIRFLVGLSGVGCYSTSYTLLTEIIVGPSKVWICSLFNTSYGFAMIILSYLAYNIQYWRTLQIIMSIPTVILPFYFWLLPESPQWLLSKNRHAEAWNIIQKIDPHAIRSNIPDNCDNLRKNATTKTSLRHKLTRSLNEFTSLFSTPTLAKRSLISVYVWFTLSATYFGLTMNGDNFNVDRYSYITLSGILEVFSYVLPIPLLSVCGRKTATLLLFSLTGISLISIVFLQRDFKTVILVMALFGRFFISAAYVIFALYTSELFPTAVRNTAIGASITMSHVGTFASSYIVELLGACRWYMPSTVFGLLVMGGIFIIMPLPETKNRPLFNTIEEMNRIELNK